MSCQATVVDPGRKQEAGVPDDLAGRVVDRDEEAVRRDARSVDVAGAELREVAGGHRLVAAGDVGERLEGDGVDAGDEVGLLGERRELDAGRVARRSGGPGRSSARRTIRARSSSVKPRCSRNAMPSGRAPTRAAGGRSCRPRGAVRDRGEQCAPDALPARVRVDDDRGPERRG